MLNNHFVFLAQTIKCNQTFCNKKLYLKHSLKWSIIQIQINIKGGKHNTHDTHLRIKFIPSPHTKINITYQVNKPNKI